MGISRSATRFFLIIYLSTIIVEDQCRYCDCTYLQVNETEKKRILFGGSNKKKEHNAFHVIPVPAGISKNSERANLFLPSALMKVELAWLHNNIAFGLFSPVADEDTFNLISLWWVEGAVGCIFREYESRDVKTQLKGLDVCRFPNTVVVATSPSYSFALIPKLLRSSYPNRKWYIVGDDDTMFSPLALAQWLQNFDPSQPWYIGGRSENVDIRLRGTWDVAFGGGGISISDGFLQTSEPGFSRCLEVAPRSRVKGSSILHLCMSRFGVPLTANGGFHQMDEKDPMYVRHILEDHPVAPFLSLKFKRWQFKPLMKLQESSFFESMSRDPFGFLSLMTFEVDSPMGPSKPFLGVMSSGFSIRLWPYVHGALLWDHTRTESVTPPPDSMRKQLRADAQSEIRYSYSRVQHQLPDAAGVTLTLYVPEEVASERVSEPLEEMQNAQRRISSFRTNFTKQRMHHSRHLSDSSKYPWGAIVVVEEVGWPSGLLLGSPRQKCHIASHQIEFVKNHETGQPALVLRIRDCAFRDSQHASGKKELLGGMTGSALADLIAHAGGPPNVFNGMREKEIDAPMYPFFPRIATTPKVSPSSFHEAGGRRTRRLEMREDCKYVAWRKKVVCEEKEVTEVVTEPFSAEPSISELPKVVNSEALVDSNLIASAMAPSWTDWLRDEKNFVVNDIVFGILTSRATAESRLQDLKYWWLPGSKGCLSSDNVLPTYLLKRLVPSGLEVCSIPPSMANRPWMKQGHKGRGLHRGAMMHVILLAHFPAKKWYIVGDDDTMFSPLALAQWLQNFDPSQPWYIGGRSEEIKARKTIGWDMAFGGGGIVLSHGFLSGSGDGAEALRRCFDVAPWTGGPGGDWILYRCLSRIGLPLTPNSGFHQMDDHSPLLLRSVLESHPVAPFISVHHVSSVFKEPSAILDRENFFKSLYHDPINFMQNNVVEILGGVDGAPTWTLAISSGLSVRLWPGNEPGAVTALWEQTRSEVIMPSIDAAKKSHQGELRYLLALNHASFGGGPLALTGVSNVDISVSIYRPDGDYQHPYRFIVVTEERFPRRWVGAPRKLCHSTTYEVHPGKSTRTSVLGVGDAVLMVGLRDCHANPKQHPRIITRESFLALVARASSPDPPALDSTCTYTELPSGLNFIGRGVT